MIEVELYKIIINENRRDQMVVLKEVNGDRLLPIVIGFSEASSIQMAIAGLEAGRPMTHDLTVDIMDVLDANLERLIIDEMVNNTFHAKLEVRAQDAEVVLVDARPSDGLALAVRFDCPIYVEDHILGLNIPFNI